MICMIYTQDMPEIGQLQLRTKYLKEMDMFLNIKGKSCWKMPKIAFFTPKKPRKVTSMKLHDCEAIEIEIWKCQASFNRSWECQESSENLLRNYIETVTNCIETVG